MGDYEVGECEAGLVLYTATVAVRHGGMQARSRPGTGRTASEAQRVAALGFLRDIQALGVLPRRDVPEEARTARSGATAPSPAM